MMIFQYLRFGFKVLCNFADFFAIYKHILDLEKYIELQSDFAGREESSKRRGGEEKLFWFLLLETSM